MAAGVVPNISQITSAQRRTLLAAALGWMLDAFDAMLYALVLAYDFCPGGDPTAGNARQGIGLRTPTHGFYLRLSVMGSGWISTRNSSGASSLKRISSSVDMSCTRDKARSSDRVQWHET